MAPYSDIPTIQTAGKEEPIIWLATGECKEALDSGIIPTNVYSMYPYYFVYERKRKYTIHINSHRAGWISRWQDASMRFLGRVKNCERRGEINPPYHLVLNGFYEDALVLAVTNMPVHLVDRVNGKILPRRTAPSFGFFQDNEIVIGVRRLKSFRLGRKKVWSLERPPKKPWSIQIEY